MPESPGMPSPCSRFFCGTRLKPITSDTNTKASHPRMAFRRCWTLQRPTRAARLWLDSVGVGAALSSHGDQHPLSQVRLICGLQASEGAVCGGPGCGCPHQAVEPRHEWLRGRAPGRNRGDHRRAGAVAARPAPLRDHVLRHQRVDRAERGRPDHQRARRGRGGRARGALPRPERPRQVRAGRRTRRGGRGHIRLRAPGRQAHRVRRGAGDDDHRPRGDAGKGIRARRVGDLGARSTRSTRRASMARRQTEGESLPRPIPSTRGCSTTWRAARASPDGGRRRSSISGCRSSARSGPALSPPATRTSIRFATTLRSGSWWGRPSGRYSKRIRFGSSRMRRIRAGTPATTAFAGTSRVTTAFVPITALSPTVTPRRMQAP